MNVCCMDCNIEKMRLILRSGPDLSDDDDDKVEAVVAELSDSKPIKLELLDMRSASIVTF